MSKTAAVHVRYKSLYTSNSASLLKALANEDTLLPTQMFPRLPAHATFVADTNFVSGGPFLEAPGNYRAR